MDRATPLWRRLAIEERSGRVVLKRTVTKAHVAVSRYFEFNAPVSNEAPRVG